MGKKLFENKYGYFTEDGREYVITEPRTPRPWANVISNGDYSFMVSQAGGGYSWRGNAEENRLTRYFQDIIKDNWGKYIYIRDEETKEFWSAGWKPVCKEPDFFETRHGIGYTILTQEVQNIRSSLKMFVVPDEPLEIWEIELFNKSDRERELNLFSYLEWNLGVGPDNHREFNKIFIDNNYFKEINGFITTSRNWGLANQKGQMNNRDWEYAAFHSVSEKPLSYDGDKESFLGMYRTAAEPLAMSEDRLARNEGKFVDPIGSLQVGVKLKPREKKKIIFTLGCADNVEHALELTKKYHNKKNAAEAYKRTNEFWSQLIDKEKIETPDKAMNIMTNIWLKYQAISCRIWGKAAYYQVSGGYGYRDQLQDCQIFFNSNPEYAREQILKHAEKQKKDGSVLHWWLTISEIGPETTCSDDLLWLPFITINYLKETNDQSILREIKAYLDGGEGTIYEHCKRSIERVFRRFSPRGIPLMGAHDWNDGLNAVGWEGRGESFWVAEFLTKILREFKDLANLVGDNVFADKCTEVAHFLVKTVNEYGWDGEWYLQGTTDKGEKLGSRENKQGWIYLNPQIWAVISGIAGEERANKCMDSVSKYLQKDYGPVLLYPEYSKVREDIGYITRYAPGLRENGGVYTHAATWAIAAYAMLGKADKAYEIYQKICSPYRSVDIDSYKVEPYVLPGNTDGPNSPNYGRGGWTWYTGSAQWLQWVAVHWILGVRPTYTGLIIDPLIPAEWAGFTLRRCFRKTYYNISVDNKAHVNSGIKEIRLDGKIVEGNILPDLSDEKEHDVKVIMG